MSMLFDRYLSEEFDEPIEVCFKRLKNDLAVKKRGTKEVLYYIYGNDVVNCAMEFYSISDRKKSQIKRDYLHWLHSNHKKFVVIDDVYFVHSKSDIKNMKKEIIAKPNKVFINGGK